MDDKVHDSYMLSFNSNTGVVHFRCQQVPNVTYRCLKVFTVKQWVSHQLYRKTQSVLKGLPMHSASWINLLTKLCKTCLITVSCYTRSIILCFFIFITCFSLSSYFSHSYHLTHPAYLCYRKNYKCACLLKFFESLFHNLWRQVLDVFEMLIFEGKQCPWLPSHSHFMLEHWGRCVLMISLSSHPGKHPCDSCRGKINASVSFWVELVRAHWDGNICLQWLP